MADTIAISESVGSAAHVFARAISDTPSQNPQTTITDAITLA